MLHFKRRSFKAIERGIFKDASKGFVDFLGINREEFINKSITQFVSPESLAVLREFYIKRLRGEKIESCIITLIDRNGKKISVELSQKTLGNKIINIIKI